jgi:hypothetical protein
MWYDVTSKQGRNFMLYYVKSGNIDTSLYAKSPRQAAVKSISSFNDHNNLGICVIVSEKEILESEFEQQVYFLTSNILEECNKNMRLVS